MMLCESARHDRARSDWALCRKAEACKRYSDARLECATAGDLKTCIDIKMGTDAAYGDICSGLELEHQQSRFRLKHPMPLDAFS
jgi:hypothetical protein